jgi:tetratricopeptide (TPR) repeat protein
LDRAILDFRNASRIMPKDPEPHYQLGLAFMGTGNGQAAVRELMDAVKIDPKHVGAQLKLAELMLLNRDPKIVKEGQQKAEAVLELSPDNPDALHALALTELRLEDPQDAVQHLEQALRKAPQHLNSAVTLALAKLRDNDVAGAEQVMLRAVADAPLSADHAVALGRIYLLIRKPADAEKQFRRALEIDPKDGSGLVELGNTLFREGKLGEAEQAFARASALSDKQYRHMHAIFLLETGKSDQAIAEFARRYKADPQDRETRTSLVSVYFRLGRTQDAANILTEALKKNAKDTDALMQRGELSLSAGKYQEAQADLTEVLRFHADSPQAHLIMSRIHEARHNTSNQVNELSEALRLNPRLLMARVELARAYTRDSSPKAAREVLKGASATDQQNLAVLLEKNAALFALGEYSEVRKDIDQELKVSRNPALVFQDGLLKLSSKDYNGARASFEEALKLDPQNWSALSALAASYLAERRVAEATAMVKQRTAGMPNFGPAQQFLGTWLARMGDLVGARTAFERLKVINPNSTAADFGLAGLDTVEGKLESARNTLNSVLTREPRNMAALLNLATVEQRIANPAGAIAAYEKVLQEDPRNIESLNNLAYLMADLDLDLDRALALAQSVKQLKSNDSSVDDTIGWAYYKKGMYRAALPYLEKASTPLRKCHLAMAYVKLGEQRRALTLLQAILTEDPNLPAARTLVSMLGQAR